jgi:hypothetical protein
VRSATTDDGRGFVYTVQGETRVVVAIGSGFAIAERAMELLQEGTP